jgi:hypothetical protein
MAVYHVADEMAERIRGREDKRPNRRVVVVGWRRSE